MNVHLINPSHVSFGTAVITPRWQYVLAGATPKKFGDPILVDETLSQMDPERIQPGDAVGISPFTPPMRCAATKLGTWRASAGRM